MSAYKFVTLTCDGCYEIHDSGCARTVTEARAAARAEAWTNPARNDDRCPVCSGTHIRLEEFGFVPIGDD